MQFFVPDTEKFACLRLAYHALKEGGNLPCYMNAANETLVGRFLNKQISWLDISLKLEKLMLKQSINPIHSFDDIMLIDAQAREEALLY